MYTSISRSHKKTVNVTQRNKRMQEIMKNTYKYITEKFNKTKNVFFEKTGKMDNTLARLLMGKQGKHKLPIWEMKKATSLHPIDFENTMKTYYDSQHH